MRARGRRLRCPCGHARWKGGRLSPGARPLSRQRQRSSVASALAAGHPVAGLLHCGHSVSVLSLPSGHIDPADMPKDAIFPNHHLAEGPVNINANHASHARLPLVAHDGSGGRHDNYGFALTAQPGESQRRPATNTSSQLIVRVGLPAPSCSRRLCPGWSHHTPQSI